MEIFKELKKIGYKHYVNLTIEELENQSINTIKKRIEYSFEIHSNNVNNIIGENPNSAYVLYRTPHHNYYKTLENALLKAIELSLKLKNKSF